MHYLLGADIGISGTKTHFSMRPGMSSIPTQLSILYTSQITDGPNKTSLMGGMRQIAGNIENCI